MIADALAASIRLVADARRSRRSGSGKGQSPGGQLKFLHLWPVKFLRARLMDYASCDGVAGYARGGLLQSVAFSLELEHGSAMHESIQDGGLGHVFAALGTIAQRQQRHDSGLERRRDVLRNATDRELVVEVVEQIEQLFLTQRLKLLVGPVEAHRRVKGRFGERDRNSHREPFQ